MAGIFNEAVLTTKGIALLAKAQAGRCTIALTKAETGDGAYADGEDLKARTALKSQRQTFPLITVRTQNATNVYVKFIITNKPESGGNLAQGYYVKEVGLFATDPDEGEILYAIQTPSSSFPSGSMKPTASKPSLFLNENFTTRSVPTMYSCL